MPLKIVRAPDNQTLWATCADRFLDRVGDSRGPGGHPAWLWLSHRNLRDALMEQAEARGLPGWLGPPVAHLGDLPELFGIRDRPVGLLTRRRMLSRLASELGRQIMGREPGHADGVIRGHMLDSLLSDLLPEGVGPERLAEGLEATAGDDFARRRNRWIVQVYARYLDELERRGLRDWRSVHASIAERIEAGGLAEALEGAGDLHVYGITNPRTRRRLLRALADQGDVEVSLYLPLEPEPGELDVLLADAEVETLSSAGATTALRIEGPADVPTPSPWSPAGDDDGDDQLSFADLLDAGGIDGDTTRQDATPADSATGRDTDAPGRGPDGIAGDPAEAAPKRATPAGVRVQPAPDAAREMDWVARRVKRLLVEEKVEPHRIAVVARSGREDTRRAHRALGRAGVPCSARIRTPLNEIAALKALLVVLRGAARGWDYRSLRAVLDHPYFDTRVDLRGIDFIATQRRVVGLAAWEETLERLLQLVEDDHRDTWGQGLFADRLEKDLEGLRRLRETLEPLGEPRTEADWIRLTLELLGGDRGLLFLRRRLCDPAEAGDTDVNLDAYRADGRGEPGDDDEPSEGDPAGAPGDDTGAPPTLRLVGDEPEPAGPGATDAATTGPPDSQGPDPRGGDDASDDGDGRSRSRHDIVRLDQRGLLQVERLLGEWLQLDHPDEPMEPGDWHSLLKRLLEANELVLSTPLQKGVQVLEAHDAALAPFEHVFVVHANDGEFPRISGAAGVLTNPERARLAEAGLPVSHRDEALRRERSLWRAVTAQAGGVTVTYRSTDPAGTPLLPSLMVPEHDPATELPRTRRPDAEKEPTGPAAADRLAAERLAQRRWAGALEVPVVAAPVHPELLRQAVVAAVAEWHRGPGRERAAEPDDHPALRPNPWNGWLRDPELLDWLAERFDEEEYDWSASQLETYGRCPFLFLTSRYVLNLEELEEAEEETTPLTFGAAAHDILERFYREVKDDLPGAFTREARERLDAVCDRVFAEREAEGEWLGLPALWATAREKVRRHLHEYVAWELGYLADKNERPFQVEREFGFGDEAVWLRGRNSRGAPARMRLRGRIDRVDQGGVRKIVHHVLDYKSGNYPSTSAYLDGSTLQGALYLQVLADQGFEMRKARYRVLRSPGRPKNGAEITFGSEEHETALTLALSIPARVRAGIFEAVAASAPKAGWKPWDPGLEVRRNDALIPEGHRFETSKLRVVDEDEDEPPAEAGDEPAAGDDDAPSGPRPLDPEGDDG